MPLYMILRIRQTITWKVIYISGQFLPYIVHGALHSYLLFSASQFILIFLNIFSLADMSN